MKLFAALVLLSALTLHAEKKIIHPPEFEGLAPPFSFGILVDGTLYVSGQLGRDIKTNKIADNFEQEVRTSFERIGLILKAAGMTYEDIVSVHIDLTDATLAQRMNAVYRSILKAPLPTRSSAIVAGLAEPTAHIEITVIARK